MLTGKVMQSGMELLSGCWLVSSLLWQKQWEERPILSPSSRARYGDLKWLLIIRDGEMRKNVSSDIPSDSSLGSCDPKGEEIMLESSKVSK